MTTLRDLSTVPFNGMHIMVVEAGTKVKDERSGEEVVIDDETAASKGLVIYCTQKIFDAMKEEVRNHDKIEGNNQ